MRLWVNGEALEWQPDTAVPLLSDFLSAQGYTPPFAVARNRQFIGKAQYAQTVLNESDQLEIVRAVTGG